MARTNTAIKHTPIHTAEGAKAQHVNPEMQLRRSVMACMLWENSFYEDGVSIAERIASLVKEVKPEKVAEIAIEAREKMKLRHIPLWLCRSLASIGKLKAETLERVIQRADELSEFVSLYWKGKKQPLSSQVKKGLAKAFTKFNEYALAKYNRDNTIKLRDVLFLSHAKPKDEEQAALWKRLINNELAVPDTWEVELSASKDKKASWERLLAENKLGALALLRNLRNMQSAGINDALIKKSLTAMKIERVLPFRFIAAAKYAPSLETDLEQAMYKSIEQGQRLQGKTILIVDTSGSMYGAGNISAKSELTRVDAAAGLAMLIREISENPVIYATAGNDHTRIHATKRLPSRRGFALRDLICKNELQNEIGGGGIFLTQCLSFIKEKESDADRIIVITDEQDCDLKLSPQSADAFGKKNYLINISIEKNGVAYDKFVHINGWSESIIDYILEYEKLQ